MKQKFPKHLSYNYKLPIDSLPARANDRLSLTVILSAVFIGFIMFLLGVFELNNSLYDVKAETIYKLAKDFKQPLISHTFADYTFIILGLGIIAGAIIAHIRYKKIFFDGRIFNVDFKGVFGEVEMFSENLRNYRGVRMRIEFFQFGIVNKNKYIIELEHIDPGKTIPLYISTDGSGIYDIWHYYAKRLEKPTIMDTDEGLKVIDTPDLNKNLKNYILSNGLETNYTVIPPLPKVFKYAQRSDKTVLSSKKAFWDILSVIVSVWLLFYTLILGATLYNYTKILKMVGSAWKFNSCLVLASVILILCLLWLFRREKIVIKSNRIILIYKFLLLSRKNQDVEIDHIKEIEIMSNPVNNRYYLAIITQHSIAAFGTKMPLEDLRWVKKFLIHEILR